MNTRRTWKEMKERTIVESGCGQIIFNLHERGPPSSEALTLRNGARTLLGSPSVLNIRYQSIKHSHWKGKCDSQMCAWSHWKNIVGKSQKKGPRRAEPRYWQDEKPEWTNNWYRAWRFESRPARAGKERPERGRNDQSGTLSEPTCPGRRFIWSDGTISGTIALISLEWFPRVSENGTPQPQSFSDIQYHQLLRLGVEALTKPSENSLYGHEIGEYYNYTDEINQHQQEPALLAYPDNRTRTAGPLIKSSPHKKLVVAEGELTAKTAWFVDREKGKDG
ncbi:hypothetical protein ARMGADRAFT_1036180 [Armillaria gallica]|uniref:Uncharacterized protein n=1 Tax=Armillaria gallica TaxID=47427 RepID=A0A2H3DBX4_ARMGA|nr:hypothetical protein ARMGADRAFT_1036180 [Armillaria gallica]